MAANPPYNGPRELIQQSDGGRLQIYHMGVRYCIDFSRLLGHGKFGYVYPITRNYLGDIGQFAAKIVDSRLVPNKDIRQESAIQSNITFSGDDLRNIVQQVTFFYHQDNWAIAVLEYMPGGTLEAYIVRVGQLSPKKVADFTKNILHGLIVIHQNDYAHRDLTLRNLLLNEDQSQLKIADFGQATWSNTKSQSGETILSRTRVGALLYMAPEVCLANMPDGYDAQKADIWSVGIVLFYMLHRRFPWTFPQEATRLEFRFWPAIFYEVLTTGGPTYDSTRIGNLALELNAGILIKDPAKRPTLVKLYVNPYLIGEIPESWGPSRAPSSASK